MIPRNTPVAIAKVPIIQYSSGHTKGRTDATGAFMPFTGFHSEMGRDGDFDAACNAARIPRIQIRHGSGNVTSQWFFGEILGLFPLTAGPVATTMAGSLTNGNARRTADAGIGAMWGQGEKSKCAVRGYLSVLAKGRYYDLVQLAVSSRMTDALIAALCDHVRACEAADALVDRSRHPGTVGLWELQLPLTVGPETTSGNGRDQVILHPFVSGHAAMVERDMVKALWRPSTLVHAAERDWPATVAWAHDYAAGGSGELSEE